MSTNTFTKEWLLEQLEKWFETSGIKIKDEDVIEITKEIEEENNRPLVGTLEEAANNVFDSNVRLCGECKTIMTEGYLIHDGDAYYCSDECLYKNWTIKEWEEVTKDDNSSCYWTEWLERRPEETVIEKYFVVYNSMDNANDFGLLTQKELTFEEAIREIRQDLPNELVATDLSEEFKILEENLEAEIGNRFYRIVLKSTY